MRKILLVLFCSCFIQVFTITNQSFALAPKSMFKSPISQELLKEMAIGIKNIHNSTGQKAGIIKSKDGRFFEWKFDGTKNMELNQINEDKIKELQAKYNHDKATPKNPQPQQSLNQEMLIKIQAIAKQMFEQKKQTMGIVKIKEDMFVQWNFTGGSDFKMRVLNTQQVEILRKQQQSESKQTTPQLDQETLKKIAAVAKQMYEQRKQTTGIVKAKDDLFVQWNYTGGSNLQIKILKKEEIDRIQQMQAAGASAPQGRPSGPGLAFNSLPPALREALQQRMRGASGSVPSGQSDGPKIEILDDQPPSSLLFPTQTFYTNDKNYKPSTLTLLDHNTLISKGINSELIEKLQKDGITVYRADIPRIEDNDEIEKIIKIQDYVFDNFTNTSLEIILKNAYDQIQKKNNKKELYSSKIFNDKPHQMLEIDSLLVSLTTSSKIAVDTLRDDLINYKDYLSKLDAFEETGNIFGLIHLLNKLLEGDNFAMLKKELDLTQNTYLYDQLQTKNPELANVFGETIGALISA